MDQLLPVLVVTTLITFIMIRQIKHVAGNAQGSSKGGSYQKYANFSVKVQNYIRAIKNDIDSSKESSDGKYVLKEDVDEKAALEELSDFLRKLVFFETLLAKQKSTKEIESELFGILSSLDEFLAEKCQNGESQAEELKEKLFEEFNKA